MEYIKKEELIKGEIYKNTGNNIIFKCINDKTSYGIGFRIINKYFVRNNWFSSNSEYLLATPKEKHWLNCCITADKFITFEEAMKTFIPEYVECTLQQIGSDYKLGEIYKVSSTSQNVNKIESHNNQGMAFYQMNKHRFKSSTKEAYDAQFVVKEPEFVLPEKWCLKVTNENRNIINKLREDRGGLFSHPIIYPYVTSLKYTGDFEVYGRELTFEQFKKYVLKEEIVKEVKIIKPLPQFKIIETIETITKVENNEGNQFFIGDVVISSSGTIQTIESFDYNKAKTNIIAFTNKQSKTGNGIGIDKIEHYIEPKVEVEETLLDKAKRLYPIGTEYKCAYSGDTYDVIFQNFEQISNSKIHAENSKGCLLYGDKWAEIIK